MLQQERARLDRQRFSMLAVDQEMRRDMLKHMDLEHGDNYGFPGDSVSRRIAAMFVILSHVGQDSLLEVTDERAKQAMFKQIPRVVQAQWKGKALVLAPGFQRLQQSIELCQQFVAALNPNHQEAMERHWAQQPSILSAFKELCEGNSVKKAAKKKKPKPDPNQLLAESSNDDDNDSGNKEEPPKKRKVSPKVAAKKAPKKEESRSDDDSDSSDDDQPLKKRKVSSNSRQR